MEYKNKFSLSIYRLLFLSLLLIAGTAAVLSAQPADFNHPELYWKTFETEHFVVNYHQGTQRTANLAAKIAEEIYPHVTGLYQYEPDSKTELIIRDTDDYSNGGAYFYENKIEIWAENMDYILRGTHNWLRDVITHEFTHIVSIRKALKFGPHVPSGWLQVFGYESERRKDVVRGFPNVLVSYPISGITIPVWYAEGVAQFQSPSRRYDYRDSQREMILRDRVVNNKLLDLDEMSVFGKNSIGNESAYNQGFAFVRFLAKTFGDSVVRKLSLQASQPFTLSFTGVMEKVTGVPADSIYDMWHRHLQETYDTRLAVIEKHLKTGEALNAFGIGNIFPRYSPDGRKVAYLTTHSDYLSINALVIQDLKENTRIIVDGPIASSLSWSPNGRYIAYSKQTELQPNGSSYYDIYVYDLLRRRNYQITNAMRATNPDWSNNGEWLAFVVHSDGLTNIFKLKLDEFVWAKEKDRWKTAYYDLNNHRLLDAVPPAKKEHRERYFRKVSFFGKEIEQLTRFTGGRQIFHPRWSPEDKYIYFDTSINFGRDIARIPASGGEMEFVLNARYDERYPTFSADGSELYFSSDRTGIFNIYSYNLESGEIEPHTNVIGGAFMPSVNRRDDLVYSLYKDQGFRIYRVRKVNDLPPEDLVYRANYEAVIPEIQANDRDVKIREAKPYQRSFGPIGIMPRLLIDYGTIKPGFYIYSNEILDKMFFFGGADVNKDREYNLFTVFEFKLFKPTIFMEFYNQTAKITDKFSDPFYTTHDKIDVNFNLLEADVGLRGRFREHFNWELSYIYSLYRAKIGTFAYKELSTGQVWISPAIRYSYLRGHALSLGLKKESILPEVDRAINPRMGYYASFRYTREWNKFLDDFATDRVIDLEIFDKYNFNRLELDAESYFPVPATRHHAVSLRFQGGYIDKPVDDFFNFFAGSLVGLKGYSYYSIEGRKMAIGTATYRFPLARNLNFRIFNWYLDKIYLGGFYQYGDAWNEGGPTWENFKSDVGVQVRLETFSWYMFPTRIFFEAAYPLKEHQHKSIAYKQEWKFYLGILFDFDLRTDHKLRKLP